MADIFVDQYAVSLVREYLKSKNLRQTLSSFEAEQPRPADSIFTRNAVVKNLKLVKLFHKNKEREKPFESVLEIVVDYLYHKALSTKDTEKDSQAPVPDANVPSAVPPRTHSDIKQQNSPTPPPPIEHTPSPVPTTGHHISPETTTTTTTKHPMTSTEVTGRGSRGISPGPRRPDASAAPMFTQSSRPIARTSSTTSSTSLTPPSVGRMSLDPPQQQQQQARKSPSRSSPSTPSALLRPSSPLRQTHSTSSAILKPTPSSSIASPPEKPPWESKLNSMLEGRSGGAPAPSNHHQQGSNDSQQQQTRQSRAQAPSASSILATAIPRKDSFSEDIIVEQQPSTTRGRKGSTSNHHRRVSSPPDEDHPAPPRPRTSSGKASSNDLEMEEVLDDWDSSQGYTQQPPSRPRASSEVLKPHGPMKVSPGTPLGIDEGRELRKLIFSPNGPSNDFTTPWKQGLFFTETSRLQYGLVQLEGGPCGVIAAVQAFVLRDLLFPSSGPTSTLSDGDLTPARRTQALVNALCEIVWQVGDRTHAKFAVYSPDRSERGGRIRDERFNVYDFFQEEQLRTFLANRISQIMDRDGGGIIMLLYSLILTRGCTRVRDDMDDPKSTLIAAHGYCAQELVNLLLIGRAHSNVFDGELRLDGETGANDGPLLRGIIKRSLIGYLTLMESYQYCKVGHFYKNPVFPIWVICSESHYTVLFSLDKRAAVTNGACMDLYFYDELAHQDEVICLTVDNMGGHTPKSISYDKNDSTPPLEHVIHTKWTTATIDWNGTDPLL